MTLKIAVDLEAYPKDEPLAFLGLPLVPNGGEIELTEEQEANYLAHTGTTVRDGLSDSTGIKVTGTALVKAVEVEVSDIAEIIPEEGDN